MAQGGRATAKKLTAAEKRAEALRLRKAGATYEQIGQQLGCSRQMAHKYVTASLQQLASEAQGEAEELRALELARLDTLLLGLWKEAAGGNWNATDRVLKIMERRARLLGLDAPAKLAGHDGGPLGGGGAGLAALLEEASAWRRGEGGE